MEGRALLEGGRRHSFERLGSLRLWYLGGREFGLGKWGTEEVTRSMMVKLEVGVCAT